MSGHSDAQDRASECLDVAGPKAWNQLSMHILARESVGSFKTALKSHFHFVD